MKAETKNKLLTTAQPLAPLQQVGAILWRVRLGRMEVMLITSRERKRWIIPKGWHISGLTEAETAKVEAWEEAGVSLADCAVKPVGQVAYAKRLKNGLSAPCSIQVYMLRVRRLSASYPESRERRRCWMTPARASRLVGERGLRAILKAM